MNILIFDTETTGLPTNWKAPYTDTTNWPRVVQLAYHLYDTDGGLISQKNTIIRPEGYSIPPQASKVHGITTKRAQTEGKDLTETLKDFTEQLQKTDLLVAHNLSFDLNILACELYRKELPHTLATVEKLCTMKASTPYLKLPQRWGRYGYKWPNLTELHTYLFNEEFSGAHDASADVLACARCFFELLNRGVITL